MTAGIKLQWLEAARGVAACWVLLHHANIATSVFIGPVPWVGQLVANGYLGVDFFFVLSGFIIAYSSNRLLETGRGLADYVRARAIRIYVPYLPVGLAMLALLMLAPGLSAGDRSPGILTSVTLLPTASAPALSVAWTLVHEIMFYAVFSVFFLSRRMLWVVLGAWTLAILGYAALAEPTASAWRYLLAPINMCFFLGVGVFYVTRTPVSAAAAAAGLVVALAALLLEAGRTSPDRVLLALGFAGFIVCATSQWAQRQPPGRALLILGSASYSIYLVHNPVISIAVRGVARGMPALSAFAAFILISVVALIAGVAYYLAYERVALRWVRERVRGIPASTPLGFSGALGDRR